MEPKLETRTLTEHLFRNFYQEVFSSLTVKYGTTCIDIIEDALQESFYKALKSWRFDNIPKNPQSWLFVVTKNHLLNELKHGSKVVSLPTDLQFAPVEPANMARNDDPQFQVLLACARLKLDARHKMVLH